jgi:peroxiredoxin Q/BCP
MATRKKTRAKAKPKPRVKRQAARRATPKKAARAAKPSGGPAPKSLPNLEAETTGGQRLRLSDLKGRNVVIYFYPKDDTPGCTAEGCDIRDHYGDFGRRDTVVLGVSRDSVASHEKFKTRYSFPFELVADPDEKLCRAFGVIREKTLYGRKHLGVERSTFVYDRNGVLRKEFRGVKVAGHVDELLRELEKL